MTAVYMIGEFLLGLIVGAWLTSWYFDSVDKRERRIYNAKRRLKYHERKAKKHRETGGITL